MNDILSNVTDNTNWSVRESLNQNVFNLYKINVNAETSILHNEEVQENLDIDSPVGFVFVSNLKFQPKISGSKLDAIRKIVIIKSKDKFKDMLEENNIQNVTHKGSAKKDIRSTRIDTHEYRGSVIMEGRSYSVESYCMIFHNGEDYYVVGMAKPESDVKQVFDNTKIGDFEPSKVTGDVVLDIITGS